MRKFILPLIASLAFASPALANNLRAEVRGGVINSDGVTKATYGVAAGYDMSLAPMTFVGAEVSADKIDLQGTQLAYGLTGRAGIRTLTGTTIYGAGGYTTKQCDFCEGSFHAGAGLEQNMFGPLYIKGEYRHYFAGNSIPDSNAFVAGIGMKF